MLHFLYSMSIYDAHLWEHFELGLIFGFEDLSCRLYFILPLRVRCRRKYKTSRSGFSSTDEFLVLNTQNQFFYICQIYSWFALSVSDTPFTFRIN